MSRPAQVRFLRTETTMAHPRGRLLALRDGRLHVLAPDGWTRLGHGRPPGAQWLTYEQARGWCAETGADPEALDTVPVGDD